MYCGGETEKILGTVDSWKEKGSMATKVNPWDGKGLGEMLKISLPLTTTYFFFFCYDWLPVRSYLSL